MWGGGAGYKATNIGTVALPEQIDKMMLMVGSFTGRTVLTSISPDSFGTLGVMELWKVLRDEPGRSVQRVRGSEINGKLGSNCRSRNGHDLDL